MKPTFLQQNTGNKQTGKYQILINVMEKILPSYKIQSDWITT